ncbi:MAG: glycosyltransferase family 4 protein [Melioribacteraceae bacterium]|nr:glycosyltransferase family 4 protein [Melioribacteraceae bacterium]
MNILYVSAKTGWGGIMSWMVQTAEGLGSRDHNVWIVSNPKSKLNKTNYPSLNIIENPLGANYNPWTIYKLVKFIKQNSVDLVVSNIRKEVIVAGYAARIAGIKCVRRVGLHVDLNDRTKKLHEKFIDHSIIPAEYLFTKAAATESWLERNDFSVVYNGRDTKEFTHEQRNKIRESWGVKENEIVIGITVKLSPMKNVEGLINAFNSVCAKYGNVRLVITGSGGEKEKLQTLADKLSLNSSVVFNDFTHEPQLTASCYDIAVLNSHDEGFPNSLVEYMSVGAASISTNVGGVSEILVDGENGLLIDADNSKQLEQKIVHLIENPELRKQLGLNAKKTVKENFSKEKMIDDLEVLFKRLINNA